MFIPFPSFDENTPAFRKWKAEVLRDLRRSRKELRGVLIPEGIDQMWVDDKGVWHEIHLSTSGSEKP